MAAEATGLLTKLLTLEISRDGGFTHVNALKDYASGPEIARLLNKQASIGAKREAKLLHFLEAHPRHFSVRRGLGPHSVSLAELETPTAPATAPDGFCDCSHHTLEERRAAAASLEEHAIEVLRQRATKIKRRQLQRSRAAAAAAAGEAATQPAFDSPPRPEPERP